MRWIAALAVSLFWLASPLSAAEAQTTYTYDALGRLKVASPSGGTQHCYIYDAADNRTKVTASAMCVPSPPVAYDDYIFMETYGWTWSGYLGVLSNDIDGNLPYDTLTITGVTGCSCATVYSGVDIYFSGAPGSYSLQYTIKDSDNVTSSAWIYLTVVACNPDCGIPP